MRHDAVAVRAEAAARQQEWLVVSNDVADLERQHTAREADLAQKKERLRELQRDLSFSPEVAALLAGRRLAENPDARFAKNQTGEARARAELRQELGIGWDASADYVLVSKQVLSHLDFPRLVSAARPDSTASEILALSPSEQSTIAAAVKNARDSVQATAVQRNEPAGDIVAQYTMAAMDPGLEQSLSNRFAAEISLALDPERAELLVPQAWREIRGALSPWRAETLTVRRVVVDGEPDVVWETTQDGQQLGSGKVRYANYPSSWFLSLFSNGWQTLATKEGFELPPRFNSQPY
jgi:hypothetical protein